MVEGSAVQVSCCSTDMSEGCCSVNRCQIERVCLVNDMRRMRSVVCMMQYGCVVLLARRFCYICDKSPAWGQCFVEG